MQEHSNTQRTPYLYTGKELDEETGLYYYGARYYDPRTGVWQSADAILDQYLDGKRNGGAFNSRNLGLYSYGHNNPVLLVDPDGNSPEAFKYIKGFLLGPDKPATTTPQDRMPTQQQYELAKSGKLAEMWAERASPAVQDPIANVGLGVWGSFDDNVDAHGIIGAAYWKSIGAMTKFNSEMALWQASGRAPNEQEQRRFGVKIATSHLDATKQDHEGTPFHLSPRQITAYHQKNFKQFGAKRGWYGGSYLPFTDNETHWTLLQPIYCWSCDANKSANE